MVETSASSWGEYARLVLNELDRLNKLEEKHAKELADLNIKIDRLERQIADQRQEFVRRLNRIDDDQNPYSLVTRINKSEDINISESSIKKYRWGIAAFGVGLIGSIVIPIVALMITVWG